MNFATLSVLGRLTRDPETRTTTSGTMVTKFGMAVNRGFGDKKRVMFLDVTVWGEKNPAANGKLHKGDLVHVLGDLEEDTWQDKEGNERRKMVLKSNQLTMVFTGKGDGETEAEGTDTVDLAKTANKGAAKTTGKSRTPATPANTSGTTEEIPF